MVQKKKSSFRGKVASNAQRTSKEGNSFGYIKKPKGISMLTLDPEGSVKLDFIPYIVTDPKHPDQEAESGTAIKGSLWWRRPFMVHRGIGADNDTVVCLRSIGKKCPVCEFRAERKAAGDPNDVLKEYNASARNLYLVIPKGHKKLEEKKHIFDISDFLFQELLTKELKEDPDKEIFPDLEEGLTLKVRFEPGSFATSKPYPEANRIDFLERDEQYDESILDDNISLDDVLIVLSYEELKSKFLEGASTTDEDEDEEEIERIDIDEEGEPRPRPKKSLKKPAFEEEDEEEEPEEEPEDEEPAPKRKVNTVGEHSKPTRGTPSTKRRNVVEEEDEDEEETPAPKRKPLPKPQAKKVCPHKLRFGVDTELYDVCDTCDIWSECVAEHEKGQ